MEIVTSLHITFCIKFFYVLNILLEVVVFYVTYLPLKMKMYVQASVACTYRSQWSWDLKNCVPIRGVLSEGGMYRLQWS